MKPKTRKALKKRIMISGRRKLSIRRGGQNHFNSREPGKVTRNKRRDKPVAKANLKAIRRLLPYN